MRPNFSSSQPDKTFLDQLHQDQYIEQRLTDDPIAYLSKTDKEKDTMYFYKAVKQTDALWTSTGRL